MGLSGSLDLSFGLNGNGIVTTDLSPPAASIDVAKAVVVQSDGKIIVAGTTSYGSALVRYGTNGAIDLGFGTEDTGIVRLAGVTIDAMALHARDANLNRGEAIVVAGSSTNQNGNTDFFLASFTKNGQADTNFGTISSGTNRTGRVTTDFALLQGSDVASLEQAHALVIQADGKIVVVGETGNPPTVSTATNWDFVVARYLRNGDLDTTFGSENTQLILLGLNANHNGFMITNTGSMYDYATAVALQGDTLTNSGKIVVVGYANFALPSDDFVVVRYDNLGNPDASFGPGTGRNRGIVVTDFGVASDGVVFSTDERALAVVVQPDGTANGKIVVAGGQGGAAIALARYKNDGMLDETFGPNNDGKVIDGIGNYYRMYAMALQTDGKLIVAGSYDECQDGCLRFFAGRYNGDGSLDMQFGKNGKAATNINSNNNFYDSQAYAIALQPNGKIIAAGHAYGAVRNDFAVVRYNP